MTRMCKFGQPLGSVMQVAYVVDDLEAAAMEWVKNLNVGPWVIMEHFPAKNMKYYDDPTDIDLSIALAYSGSMCFELIFQHNDVPSVYTDCVKTDRMGCFHHWAVSTVTFDEDVARHKANGHKVAFYGEVVPVGGKRFAYIDTMAPLRGMIELIELNDDVEGLFAGVRAQSQDWDGADPIRRP